MAANTRSGVTGVTDQLGLASEVSGALPTEVDYVVVGAGAAGSVLAARLSERAERTVLLVEGGGVLEQGVVGVPARFQELEKQPSV